MSLLKDFLNDLNAGRDVWQDYLIPLTDNTIDEFNNNSHYIHISREKITFSNLEQYYPIYSKIDNLINGIVLIDDNSLARIKFIEILEECSSTIVRAKDENRPYEDIKKLVYQFREGLKTLYCSMSVEDMKQIRASLAFDNNCKKGTMPLYKFFYERAAEWIDEKLVLSDNVPNYLKQSPINI